MIMTQWTECMLTDVKAEGDGDVMQLLLFDGAEVEGARHTV